ncbi:MAG: large subunit ribosomal protein L25 [Gammaproteobacteria bacterium]|jgi:large subunit ribosomal protein L25
MSDNIHLNAVSRTDSGKGASRRLRRQNQVPAIIYGGNNEPAQISLEHNEFSHQLENEAIYTQIIDLQVGSDSEEVILRDLQRHPYKNRILHADFYRIDNKKPIHVVVPIHVENGEECVGVKLDGGMLTLQMSEIEVVCLPKNLPEFLTIDAINVHLGEGLHLSDIAVPKGVEIVALTHGEDHDIGVLSVIKTRSASTEDEDAEAEGEGEGDSEDS